MPYSNYGIMDYGGIPLPVDNLTRNCFFFFFFFYYIYKPPRATKGIVHNSIIP